MQNNVTELTQRLLRALDSNYNVIDMPEVVVCISNLEKVAITKELLEATRLGKYVNELRRKTTDQELWRRAKELLKKWRSMVLPENNGQIKPAAAQPQTQPAPPSTMRAPMPNKASPPLQGQSLKPRVSPVPPKKVSPPIPTQTLVNPALQNRLSPGGVQRLASPGLQSHGRLVSPQIQKKLVSPHHGQLVSPAPKLVSPQNKKVSPRLQAHEMVSPGLQAHKMVSPGLQARKMVSPGLQARKMVSPGLQARKMVSPGLQARKMVSPGLQAHKLVSPHKMVSPGGIHQRVSPKLAAQAQGQKVGAISPPLTAGQNADVNLNQLKSKKRQAHDGLDSVNVKRARLNGAVTDLEVSDSSNSSFKDVMSWPPNAVKAETKQRDVIVINSDSNSSFPERSGDIYGEPKKRGRKKGSKNHRNLLDEAESSFSSKLAVSASRGSSKVKTTQEILAGIQNKNSVAALGVAGAAAAAAGLKPSKEDLQEKAAKLTERVSIIDRKLNANAHRNKNSQKGKLSMSASKPNERVLESGSVINDKSLLRRLQQQQLEEDEEDDEDEEIVVVDDMESPGSRTTEESQETDAAGMPRHQELVGARSLSEKDALALLPPIDRSVLDDELTGGEPPCTCRLKENKPSDFSIGGEDDDEDGDQPPPFEMVEDPACPARGYLTRKYLADDVSDGKILRLHEACMPNINGNWSLGTARPEPPLADGLYLNVVPHIYERLDKDVRPFDSFKKYSVSEGGGAGAGATDQQHASPTTTMTSSSNSVIKTDPDEMSNGGDGDGAEETVAVGLTPSSVSDSVIKSEPTDDKEDVKPDISDTNDIRTEEPNVFREWYECVDRPSYNGDALRILPYCVVD